MFQMKILRLLLHTFLLSLGWLIFAIPASAAYIDPNTGGMLFQVLAVLFGVISGVILIFSSRIKMLVFRIVRFIRGSNVESSPQSDEHEG